MRQMPSSRPTLMQYRLLIGALLLAAVAGLPPAGHAAATDVADIVGKIETAHRNAQDLQSAFTQSTLYEGFPAPALSKGRLLIRRPDQMRWDYREPSTHQIYVNGDVVIYLVPEHRQAIRSTMDREAQSPVPLLLLAGAARLSEQFAIDWDGPPGAADGRYRLRLTGKSAAARIAPLTIEADAKDFLIRRVTLHDPSGARTTFEFSGIKLNTGLDPKLFVFTPPEGIEIVDAPPLMPHGVEPKNELP